MLSWNSTGLCSGNSTGLCSLDSTGLCSRNSTGLCSGNSTGLCSLRITPQDDAKEAAAGRHVPELLLRSLTESDSMCMPCRYWTAVRHGQEELEECSAIPQ